MTTAALEPYQLIDRDIFLDTTSDQYVMRVRDMDITQKPREKMQSFGPETLSQSELLAVLLGVGTKREEVMAMSDRILKEYGERALLHEKNPNRLSETLQIPFGKACQIIAALELGRRFYEKRSGKPRVVRTPEQAFEYFKNMADLQKEQLRGLYLNSRFQVIREEVISTGSLTASIIHPREVFQPAIEHGAAAIIIAHNHPSGSVRPTSSDNLVTQQLINASEILGIDLLDHIIISGNHYKSIIGGE